MHITIQEQLPQLQIPKSQIELAQLVDKFGATHYPNRFSSDLIPRQEQDIEILDEEKVIALKKILAQFKLEYLNQTIHYCDTRGFKRHLVIVKNKNALNPKLHALFLDLTSGTDSFVFVGSNRGQIIERATESNDMLALCPAFRISSEELLSINLKLFNPDKGEEVKKTQKTLKDFRKEKAPQLSKEDDMELRFKKLELLYKWLKQNPGELPKELSKEKYNGTKVSKLHGMMRRLRGGDYSFAPRTQLALKSKNPELYEETVRIINEGNNSK